MIRKPRRTQTTPLPAFAASDQEWKARTRASRITSSTSTGSSHLLRRFLCTHCRRAITLGSVASPPSNACILRRKIARRDTSAGHRGGRRCASNGERDCASSARPPRRCRSCGRRPAAAPIYTRLRAGSAVMAWVGLATGTNSRRCGRGPAPSSRFTRKSANSVAPPAEYSPVRGNGLTSRSVIALRRTIERGVRHPLLGPLCLILLALLLAFTVLHGAHDQLHESSDLIVCLAIVVVALGSLALAQLPVFRLVFVPGPRAPPSPSLPPRRLSVLRAARIPLRL